MTSRHVVVASALAAWLVAAFHVGPPIGFVVIGWGFDELNVPTGLHEFSVKLPLLPIRPGAYSLGCALFNGGNNLTTGKLVENWQAQPPLIVDTAPLAHPQDAWSGVLNLPAQLRVSVDVSGDLTSLVKE